jgi:outer membrane biogenesis lipoprotein LolB
MIRRFAAFALVLVLGACAAVPQSQPFPALASVPRSFEMAGRIAISQGERSDIARLRWTRSKGSDLWVISSPLGNEVARIESTARSATLAQAGSPAQEAASFQALTLSLLGVALDPDLLAAWLHGGRPGEESSGWKFTIDETQGEGPVRVARRMTATRGDATVKLVVDSYRPLAE